MSLLVRFWGTRGSIPTPGSRTARYGGNTPCLTVEDGTALLVLDAGTGARPLGRFLADRAGPDPLAIDLLLSHTHWDHIQGLPFFQPLFREGDAVAVFGPPQPGASLESILRQQMAPAVFPIPLSGVGATLTVTELAGPELLRPRFAIHTVAACHPGPTLGFSIQSASGGPRLIYLTDNELGSPAARTRRAGLVRFLQDAHTMVHDAMYFDSEVPQRRGWGHSSATEAVTLALEAGCRHLILFHHDPEHDDAALERLLTEANGAKARLGGALAIAVAAEGESLRLEEDR